VQADDVSGQTLYFRQQVPEPRVVWSAPALAQQNLFGDMRLLALHECVGVGHCEGMISRAQLKLPAQFFCCSACLAAAHIYLGVSDKVLNAVGVARPDGVQLKRRFIYSPRCRQCQYQAVLCRFPGARFTLELTAEALHCFFGRVCQLVHYPGTHQLVFEVHRAYGFRILARPVTGVGNTVFGQRVSTQEFRDALTTGIA